jgi:hypothetical protein
MNLCGWIDAILALNLPRPLLLVLIVLARHAQADGTVAMGQKKLAGLLRQQKRAVRQKLAELEQRGLIVQLRGPAPGRPTTYRLTIVVTPRKPSESERRRQKSATVGAPTVAEILPPNGGDFLHNLLEDLRRAA